MSILAPVSTTLTAVEHLVRHSDPGVNATPAVASLLDFLGEEVLNSLHSADL